MNTLLDAISSAEITLPVMQIVILILALSVCLVFRLNRIGLLIAYVFSYSWGWRFFAGQPTSILSLYMVAGILVGTLTVITMLRTSVPD